jgi:hypothetical protein
MSTVSFVIAPPVFLDHAEEVALRILQNDEVFLRPRYSRKARCAEGEQPFDLTHLVGRVEIEVETVLTHMFLGHHLQRHIHVLPVGISEDDPTIFGWLSWHVAECLLPESRHRGQVVAIDNDGADS